MDQMSILSKVRDKIRQNTEHPLNKVQEYHNTFMDEFSIAIEKKTLNNKELSILFRKLQLNGNYDPTTYCQGICEILFWIYLSSSDFDFCTEKKVAITGNYDVDLQITCEYTFNVEIKCPTMDKRASENKIRIHPGFRTVDKDSFQVALAALKTDMLDPALLKPEFKYDGFTIDKINDNKLVEYLKSAQDKFPNSTEEICNILVIGTTIKEIQDYYSYLFNGYTGIFTGQQPIMPCENYSNVDVVVLSNMVDGHYSQIGRFNPWKLNNYFNLMLVNPCNASKNCNARKKLLEIIPNTTIQFEQFFDDYCMSAKLEAQKEKCPTLEQDLMMLLFPHYFDKYYPIFWRRK